MFLEEKISNFGWCPFDNATQADSLMEFFLFDGFCLGKVTGSTKEVLVVEMVKEVVERMVLAIFGMLLEVVILVHLIVCG